MEQYTNGIPFGMFGMCDSNHYVREAFIAGYLYSRPVSANSTITDGPTDVCKHGVPYRYDCEYCREGIEPYNCPHGIDTQMGCPQCDAAKMPVNRDNLIYTGVSRAWSYLTALGYFTTPTEEGRQVEIALIQAMGALAASRHYTEEQVIDFVMTLTGTPSHISKEAATGMVQHHFNPRPESVVADPIPPEDWDTCELFDYLVEHDLLPEDADFEDYKHDRTDMLASVQQHVDL